MLYEEKDIMVVEPYFARVIAQTPTVTGIVPEDCVSVKEAFRQVRKHIDYLYNGSVY